MVTPFKFKKDLSLWLGLGMEYTRYPIRYKGVIGGGYRYVRVVRLMLGPWEWHWCWEKEAAV